MGVESLLSEARERRAFSGAAWSFGDAGGPWSRGLLGTLAWDGAPVGEDSRWDLASVTKPIVGLAVLSLIESGELTLDDTIGEHLPEYAGGDKAALTVRDLLTHTSGIPGQVPLYKENPTREEMLTAIRELPLIAPPGKRVAYSSQGFIVLGLIAEAASGLSLETLVRDRVTEPVGMSRTSFGLAGAERDLAVATEDDPWRGRVVRGEVHDENAVVLGAPAGHAGLFAPLADLEALGAALCAGGAGRKGRLLSPAGFRTMIAPRTDHLKLRRTLAWQGHDPVGSPAGDLAGPNTFGHTGFTGTSLWVDPDAGRYVVLLTNRVHPTRENEAISPLRRRVHTIAFAAEPPSAAPRSAAPSQTEPPAHRGESHDGA